MLHHKIMEKMKNPISCTSSDFIKYVKSGTDKMRLIIIKSDKIRNDIFYSGLKPEPFLKYIKHENFSGNRLETSRFKGR